MARLITYLMAAALGLVVAVGLGIPSRNIAPEPVSASVDETRVEDAPPSAATTGAPVEARAASTPSGAAQAESQTLMFVEMVSGAVRINVNNEAVNKMDATTTYDLSPYVRPGKNKVMLRWSGPVQADIRIIRSTSGGDSREAGHAFLTLAGTQTPGESTLLFFL